jgi:hypothetical protein
MCLHLQAYMFRKTRTYQQHTAVLPDLPRAFRYLNFCAPLHIAFVAVSATHG